MISRPPKVTVPAVGTSAPENERREMDGVLRLADMLFQGGEILLAGGEQAEAIPPDGGAAAGRGHRIRDGRGKRRWGARLGPGQRGDQRGLPLGQPAELPAPEDQVERHPDVGDEDNAEQPGEGVGRRAFLAEQSSDHEKRQQETGDRQEMGQIPVGEESSEDIPQMG